MTEPLREKLRYGSPLHDFVLQMIKRRRDFSREKMQERYSAWMKAEEGFLSYMPAKDADKKREQLIESGSPQFKTVYIPYDYAVLMSAHTYVTSVFLSRNPIFQYMGTQGASQSSELATEALMNYQVTAGRMLPPLYCWLMDGLKYGVGIVHNYWDQQKTIVTRELDVPDVFMGVPLETTHKEIKRVVLPGYAGNKICNIRPFDAIPDPRVPLWKCQEGEFFGNYTSLGWNFIAKAAAEGRYFNVDVLRRMRSARTQSERNFGSPQTNRPFTAGEEMWLEAEDMSSTEIIEMYVELIPRDWGLDETSYPEKWVFVVAADSVILHAQPAGLFHNKFPYGVIEMEVDAYSMFKRGMFEIVQPLQNVVNWLYNTHFYNTRKALNDMFVVDPSMVVMKDLKDPGAGKIIRLKEEMYGRDVRQAISQLPVSNYTQAHLQDSQLIASLIQRVSGVNDNIMGMLSAGGRKTATEVRTSSTFGVNRLKTVSEWFSGTGWSDLAIMMLQNSQQLMETQMKLRIAGDAWTAPGASQYLNVSPADIQGFYDYLPVDGTLPIDRFAQVNMWTQLLGQMASSPQVLQQYDLGKIFGYVAQLGGIKNIQQFKIQVADPGMLGQQAQMGNVVPIGAANAQPGRNRAQGPATLEPGRPPVPRQVAGMGPSG
jgi:hypothetical protein